MTAVHNKITWNILAASKFRVLAVDFKVEECVCFLLFAFWGVLLLYYVFLLPMFFSPFQKLCVFYKKFDRGSMTV